jgi:hypothetical protein
MGSDAPPDDVRLAEADFIAVLEGRTAVMGPGHLSDSRMPQDALYAKVEMKALLVLGKVSDELRHCIAELSLLLWA